MKTVLILFLLATQIPLFSQSIGIGTNTPNASALLDLSSTTKGMLVPRMSTAQRTTILSPATGLLVYDTGSNGFWYYNGSSWTSLGSTGGSADWCLSGNSGTNPNTHFIGTTDNQSVLFKVNNQRAGWIDKNGSVFLGLESGKNNNGARNIGIGSKALFQNTARNQIIAIGDSSLYYNGTNATLSFEATANIAIGTRALYNNTTGYSNVSIGHQALTLNTTGRHNTAIGFSAMYNVTTTYGNTAIGSNSLYWTTTGDKNTAVGTLAGSHISSGKGNTALGFAAMDGNWTGNANVAVGTHALYLMGNMSNLVAVGDSALFHNSGEFAIKNTAVGSKALYSNVEGGDNTAVGYRALYMNSTGDGNTAVGQQALRLNTTGHFNSAFGSGALEANTTGYSNTAIGYGTLFNNSTGFGNVAVGGSALLANTSGKSNTAIGILSSRSNTTGFSNIAIGTRPLNDATIQYKNVAIGDSSLFKANSIFSNEGSQNTAVGHKSGYSVFGGSMNVFIGVESGYNTTNGENVAIGYRAMHSNTTGFRNTVIGKSADVTVNNLQNATAIGYLTTVNASNKVVIGNTAVTSIGGYAGWSNFSDGRFKQNMQEDIPGLDFITRLRPVSYTLDIAGINAFNNKNSSELRSAEELNPEKSNIRYTGFVAQEVEQTAITLGYDFSGVDKPADPENQTYALRYSEFVVPLVKAVQEQQEQIAALQSEIAELRTLIKYGETGEK